MLMPEQLLVKRARALGRGRCCPRVQSPVGLAGRFSGRGFLESDGSLLLLADNYNRTTNDLTTEAQSARRTHGDDLLTKVRAVSGLAIIAGLPEAAPGSPCCALVRAGWIA